LRTLLYEISQKRTDDINLLGGYINIIKIIIIGAIKLSRILAGHAAREEMINMYSVSHKFGAIGELGKYGKI
jgi:hypothetical protein